VWINRDSDPLNPPGRIAVARHSVDSHPIEYADVQVTHRLRLEFDMSSRRQGPPCFAELKSQDHHIEHELSVFRTGS
jgi:hypothetical protein